MCTSICRTEKVRSAVFISSGLSSTWLSLTEPIPAIQSLDSLSLLMHLLLFNAPGKRVVTGATRAGPVHWRLGDVIFWLLLPTSIPVNAQSEEPICLPFSYPLVNTEILSSGRTAFCVLYTDWRHTLLRTTITKGHAAANMQKIARLAFVQEDMHQKSFPPEMSHEHRLRRLSATGVY